MTRETLEDINNLFETLAQDVDNLICEYCDIPQRYDEIAGYYECPGEYSACPYINDRRFVEDHVISAREMIKDVWPY